MSVFYEAGLLFVSRVGSTPHRGGEASFSVSLAPLSAWKQKKKRKMIVFSTFPDLMCDSYNRKKRDIRGKNRSAQQRGTILSRCRTSSLGSFPSPRQLGINSG